MLILLPNQVCPHAATCPYNTQTGHNFCLGANSDRPGPFNCEYVSPTGTFAEGKFRSKLDETGKMKVILESGE